MTQQMRIDKLRSAVEAAGVAMAPASDGFETPPKSIANAAPASKPGAESTAGAWATPRYRTGFEQPPARPNKLTGWFSTRWPRAQST